MQVRKLIELLQAMPDDTHVWHLWDGATHTEIEYVWLARDGSVVTADHGQVCYYTESRPVDAPTEEDDPYWETPRSWCAEDD